MSFCNRHIGIFDSGVGGLTVLKQLVQLMPNENYIYVADSENAPYGSKDEDFIIDRVMAICGFLVQKEVKLIVVACNTATSVVIDKIRNEFDIPIVGIEPAIKPAVLMSKTRKIGVLATHGTFNGRYFKEKESTYSDYVEIIYQDANKLVELAELGILKGKEVDFFLNELIIPMIDQDIDQLVLGCTHYPLFLNYIKPLVENKVNVINPADAIARRTKDLLMINRILADIKNLMSLEIFTGGEFDIIETVLRALSISKFNLNKLDI